jgi:hypothetical protein
MALTAVLVNGAGHTAAEQVPICWGGPADARSSAAE